MSHHLVEYDHVSFEYQKGIPVLSQVSLTIHHGEKVAVLGGNGAGKSTFLWQMNGLLLPSSGCVRLGNLPVSRETLEEARRVVGFVFQNADDQLFMPTVEEDVAFGLLNRGMSPQLALQQVSAILKMMNLSHLMKRPPHLLSGGEKRMVALAGVLVMEPDILVLDEPSANLDGRARRLLINYVRSFEHSCLLATHDLDMAWELCDRVLIFDHGNLVVDDLAKSVLSNTELLNRWGLERPLISLI